ncbi:MAG: hypothetical protein PHE93_02405 [Clostridia bacterium]|nr:hypothetical protein [Clostridia bacterium]
MKEFSLLFELQLKNHFRSNEKSKNKIAMPIIIGLSMLPLLSIICYAIYMVMYAGAMAGIAMEILVFILLSAQMFTLFFVSKVYISIFYNADDNEFLTTLPANPIAMFMSKLIVVYISELSFSAFILLPTLITATVAMNMAGMVLPVVFYFFIPLTILFAPIIPLLIISIFAAPIMYIASFFKRRAAMSSIMSILLFVVLMGSYFALIPNFANISQLQNGLPPQAIAIFQKFANYIYFDKTFFLAALNIDFAKNFFIWLGIIIGSFAFAILLTQLLFRRSISAQFETHSKSKVANLDYKSQSISMSLVKNDFKSLMRLPGLAMNSFLNIFMAPLLLVAMNFMSDGGIAGMYSDPNSAVLSSELLVTGFVMMYSFMLNLGMNYVSMLSFTREGRSFYFLKHLPVGLNEILKAKKMFADIVSAIGIVLLMLCALLIFKINVLSVIALGIVLMVFAMGFNTLGILRDMKKPNLEWSNINEALKRNTYILMPFVIAIGIGIVSLVLAVLLSSLTEYIPEFWAITIYWIVMLIGGIVLYLVFKKQLLDKSEELFDKMGEPQVPQPKNIKLPKKIGFGL